MTQMQFSFSVSRFSWDCKIIGATRDASIRCRFVSLVDNNLSLTHHNYFCKVLSETKKLWESINMIKLLVGYFLITALVFGLNLSGDHVCHRQEKWINAFPSQFCLFYMFMVLVIQKSSIWHLQSRFKYAKIFGVLKKSDAVSLSQKFRKLFIPR